MGHCQPLSEPVDPTLDIDYTIVCHRSGWIVYKGPERRFPAAAGFATSAQAEEWMERAREADRERQLHAFYDHGPTGLLAQLEAEGA